MRAFEERAKHPGAVPARSQLQSYSQRLKELQLAARSRELDRPERIELAVCAYNVGEHDLALRTLVESHKKYKDDRTLYWLSLVCRAAARETLHEAIESNPGSYRAHLLLADLANGRHDRKQALKEYERALELGGDDPEVHLVVVRFLRSKGMNEEALKNAEAAVRRFPAHPALNCELGKLLAAKRKPQEAARYFQRSLEADSTLAEARAGLADSYAAMGEVEKAIREMERALADDPDGSYHYRLGRWLQKTGQPDAAAEAFSISTKLKQQRAQKERERFLQIERDR